MGDKKVLSYFDYEQIEGHLKAISNGAQDYFNGVDNALKIFNDNPIVQSFYASGNLGKEMEEELLKVTSATKKYFDVLFGTNGLINTTKLVVDYQKELLNSDYKGGN